MYAGINIFNRLLKHTDPERKICEIIFDTDEDQIQINIS